MNQIKIRGVITSPIEFDYQFGKWEKFYKFMLSSKRLSGIVDVLPCCVSERLISNFSTGDVVSIVGEIRTRNVNRHLEIKIFVKEISACDDDAEDYNDVKLKGYIVKESCCRSTPSGRRITDFIIAANRTYGVSDYLPCIAWGRNADFVQDLPIGKKVNLIGRIQSREYQKVIDGVEETKTAYEVSGSYIGESEDKENG